MMIIIILIVIIIISLDCRSLTAEWSVGFTAQRLFVSQGSCSAARGSVVAVSVPLYNTDTRTQPEHYDCTQQVMIAVRHGDCFCTGLQQRTQEHSQSTMTVHNRSW